MSEESTHRVSGIRVEVRCPHCHDLFPTHDAFVEHRQKEHPPELIKLSHVGGIGSEENVQGTG